MTDIDYTTIVVGFDGSEQSLLALRFAQEEIKIRGADASLVVIGALTDTLGLGRDDELETQRSAAFRDYLRQVIDDPTISVEVFPGEPAAVLTDSAAPAALLVIAKRGRGGFEDLVLGSTALSCLQLARSPVAVLSGDEALRHDGPIVVGIDSSAASHRALAWAVDEAIFRDVSIDAISVWRKPHLWEPIQGSPDHYQDMASRALEAALASVDPLGRTITAQSVEGERVQVLVARSATAGAIILGNETHEGGRIHGHSIAISVVTHAKSPVIVCP